MDKKFRISDIKSQHQCAQVGKNTIWDGQGTFFSILVHEKEGN
jgi:hypothetical protein